MKKVLSIVVLLLLICSCSHSDWDEMGEIKTPDYFEIESYLTLAQGESYTIKANTDLRDYAKIEWSSEQPELVEVDKMGRVTALKSGKTKITARAFDQTSICEITVNEFNPAYLIRLHDGTFPGIPYMRVGAPIEEVAKAEGIMQLRKLFVMETQPNVSVYVNKDNRVNRVEYHHIGSKFGPMIRANSMDVTTQLGLDKLVEDYLFPSGFQFITDQKGVVKEGYNRPLNIKIYRNKRLGIELKTFLDFELDIDGIVVAFGTLQFLSY